MNQARMHIGVDVDDLSSFASSGPCQMVTGDSSERDGCESVTYNERGRATREIVVEIRTGRMVGARGFEPPTFCSQSRRTTRLCNAPL